MIDDVFMGFCPHGKASDVYCEECPSHIAITAPSRASSETAPEMMDVPIIPNTFPVVLYLGNEEDREELIQAMMTIHPDMMSRKL